MSVAADFGVTQVVDGTLGVHARIDRASSPQGQRQGSR
jgi:acetamidase/formamidase